MAIALYAPILFIQVALAVKRAHDRSHGGLLAAVLVLATGAISYVPDNGLVTLGGYADQGAVWAWPLMVAAVLINASSLYLVIVLGFLDGTPGPNRFGPSPKGLSGGAPAFMAPGGLE